MGSYKEEDHNPAALRLFPSDIAGRSWLSAAARAETDPSTLRLVVRDHVKDRATQMMI